MSNAEFFRQPTTQELADFTPLTSRRDADLELVHKIQERFRSKNRKLLVSSDNPISESPSCDRCWRLERVQNENSDDLDSEFINYQNRLEFKKLTKVAGERALVGVARVREFEFCFAYKCVYCQQNSSFMFRTDQFKPEVAEKLTKTVASESTED